MRLHRAYAAHQPLEYHPFAITGSSQPTLAELGITKEISCQRRESLT